MIPYYLIRAAEILPGRKLEMLRFTFNFYELLALNSVYLVLNIVIRYTEFNHYYLHNPGLFSQSFLSKNLYLL